MVNPAEAQPTDDIASAFHKLHLTKAPGPSKTKQTLRFKRSDECRLSVCHPEFIEGSLGRSVWDGRDYNTVRL